MPLHEHGERPYDWVGDLAGRRAALTPDRVGLVDADTGREFTYADLDDRATRTARLLRDRGVGAGDRVAVVSRNRPELVDLYFATGKIGAVLTPLSHRLAPRETGDLLSTVEPSLLVVEAPFADDVATAIDGRDDLVDVPVLGLADDGEASGGPRGWPRFGAEQPGDDAPVETASVALSDPHLFLHTGGSTGLPKEVVLPHGSIAWNAFTTITSWGLRPDDVTPLVFPMFHTGGWNVLTVPFFHLGATVVIAREFDPAQVLATVEARDATVLVAVPAVLRFMAEADEWDATDLSSLRFAKSGGGPCRDAVIEAWSERGVDLSQGYGLTECGPNNFAMPAGFPREKTATIGKPGLYVDARVVDEDGDPLPQGEVGELELASPHAADRYWRNEAETADAFGGGWVSTGDLARVDADGYYRIEGRKKNMFVSGGENVFPPAVEDVVATHPSVDDVVVIPVPDETWGEVGTAVLEGDESLTIEALRAFCDGKLAPYEIPRHLAFVDELPTSGPDKVDREAVKRRFGGGGDDTGRQ